MLYKRKTYDIQYNLKIYSSLNELTTDGQSEVNMRPKYSLSIRFRIWFKNICELASICYWLQVPFTIKI